MVRLTPKVMEHVGTQCFPTLNEMILEDNARGVNHDLHIGMRRDVS